MKREFDFSSQHRCKNEMPSNSNCHSAARRLHEPTKTHIQPRRLRRARAAALGVSVSDLPAIDRIKAQRQYNRTLQQAEFPSQQDDELRVRVDRGGFPKVFARARGTSRGLSLKPYARAWHEIRIVSDRP
jgi:hypothetical protein